MTSPLLVKFWLERHATKIFWILCALHLVLWTLIPALTQPNAPLDTIEGFAWGREWPLGTYKHPPLQAWLLEISYQICGTNPVGYFGLSTLCTAAALWAIYRTGRLLASPLDGLLAAMLAQSILYFTFLAPEFNPNVLQLVCWAAGGYALSHALVCRKAKYWLLLAIVFAGGFYAKYTMGILALSFGLFLLVHPKARESLKTPWPYAALGITALLIAPHVIWLFDNHFLPFSYAAERAEPAKNIGEHVLFQLHFALSQLACLAPALAGAAVILLPLEKERLKSSLKTALTAWLAFAPLALVMLGSLIAGEKLRDMWGMPFLSFIPLWLVRRFEFRPRFRFFMGVWGLFFMLTLAAFAGNQLFATSLGFKPLRGHFPGRELSAALLSRWHERAPGPLRYVIGDAWIAGNTAFYASGQQRPHVWIDGGSQTSQWINPRDVQAHGAMLVWRGAAPGWVKRFPDAKTGQAFVLSWQTPTKEPGVEIGWAYLSPETHGQGESP